MLKRNDLSSYEKTWRNLKCIILSERSQLKGLHSNSMTFWKRQNYGDNKKISGSQKFIGEGGMKRQSTEDFSGQ